MTGAVVPAVSPGRSAASPRPRPEGPDLRLLPCALAAWAAAAVAVGVRPSVAAVGAVCCAAVGLALLLAALAHGPGARGRSRAPGRPAGEPRGTGPEAGTAVPRRRGSARVALAMALFCAAAAAGSGALHAADLYRGPLPGLARQSAEITAEVTVTGDPRLTRPRVNGPRSSPPAVVLAAEARRVTAADGAATEVRTPVLLIVPLRADTGGRGGERAGERAAWLRLLPSTRLRLEARAVPSQGGGDRMAAVLRVSGKGPPVVVRGPTAVQRAAGELRAGLREASDGLPADARALLPGLVVGDTSRVPADLDRAFHATDLVHLLSVSGANLTIVLALLIGPPHLALRAERRGLAPRFGIPLRGTALLGGLLTLGFVIVCRPEPSVLRAAACGGIALLAIATGRRRSLLPALAAAVLLLVLYDPWLARSYGFLLSVLATGALLTIAPRWSAALQRRRVPGRLAEVLAAAAAAQAVCAPVVAVLAARVSLVAVPCNLFAELAVAPATVLGFAALATAPFAMPAAEALARLAAWPVEWIAAVARTGAALPGAELDWPGGWTGGLLLAALTALLVPVAPRLARHPWLCAACALVLLAVVLRPGPLPRFVTGWPPPGWRLAVCDVGQGEALVLAAGGDRALVVDAGPEPEAVDRCLRSLGVRHVPLLVLTHFHADHVAGLPGVLRGRAVGAIETTTLEEPPGQAAFVRRTAAAAGVRVLRTTPGERRLGPVAWRVLWPLPGRTAVTGANDASVTMLVRTAGLTLLLLGDLEPPAQQRLASTVPLPPVDVLKVAHHGSARQDHGLLARLRPRIAVISCGAGNDYGHPAPRTVAALRAGGAVVLRTDTDGAIAVTGPPARPGAAVTAGGASPAGSRGRRRARGRGNAPGSRRCRCETGRELGGETAVPESAVGVDVPDRPVRVAALLHRFAVGLVHRGLSGTGPSSAQAPSPPRPALALPASLRLQPAVVLGGERVQGRRVQIGGRLLDHHQPLGVLGVVLTGERLPYQFRFPVEAETLHGLGGRFLGRVPVGQHQQMVHGFRPGRGGLVGAAVCSVHPHIVR
ncbi:ComEC/Rec2 family competence protein [Streptomyces sp. S07_1.15]|uniref:ComEC/Rec2 family competence protein n=1 Tax=Streptomyces sp. S07_1.15 TaxID=2873925 RepID=UPI0035A82369